jgi:hypothetical protein
MIKYTTKIGMSSYSHIFTHKCKKVNRNLFNRCQTIMVHNIEFIICCIQHLKNFSVPVKSVFEID